MIPKDQNMTNIFDESVANFDECRFETWRIFVMW